MGAALELADDEAEFLEEARRIWPLFERELRSQEFLSMMRGQFDKSYSLVEINSGSGGTEAQDWAEMLLRMYLRWAERKGFKSEILDYQPGDGAGIKSATLYVQGDYAYGTMRSESGVHRLVRISPFDSNARRHTSFASVSVSPDIEEEIEIEIDESELRIDTYRSSGAGGQHVNKTDSAVRITHIPTNTVVACQSERSQHKNKDRAFKILKAKLYELQKQAQLKKMDEIKGERKKIDFGSQIRSYVMQPYQMVKDLRTGFETSSVNEVLDGEIDPLIESYLLSDHNVV
jgi:peptide chain release factor 2